MEWIKLCSHTWLGTVLWLIMKMEGATAVTLLFGFMTLLFLSSVIAVYFYSLCSEKYNSFEKCVQLNSNNTKSFFIVKVISFYNNNWMEHYYRHFIKELNNLRTDSTIFLKDNSAGKTLIPNLYYGRRNNRGFLDVNWTKLLSTIRSECVVLYSDNVNWAQIYNATCR